MTPHPSDAADPGQDDADHPWARADDTPDATPTSTGEPSGEPAEPGAEPTGTAGPPPVGAQGTVRIVQGHPTGFEPSVNKGGQNGAPKPDGRSARTV